MTKARTDWENTASFDIGGHVQIDLPEFWTVEKEKYKWVCYQPGLGLEEDCVTLWYERLFEPVPPGNADVAAQYMAADHFDRVFGANHENELLRYRFWRTAPVSNGIAFDSFRLGIAYSRCRLPEMHALRRQIRQAVLSAQSDLGDPSPSYREVYGDPVTGAAPSKTYAWMNEIAPRRFDQSDTRFISEFVKMDIPDSMSCVRIAPLVWKCGDLDESLETRWGSITIALEYVDSRDPTEEEIAQAEAGDWDMSLPEGILPEVDRIVNEPIPPYPTYIDKDGETRHYIDHMPYNPGMPSRSIMEIIDDSLDEPIFYKTLKFRLHSTPFGLRKAYMAVALRYDDVSSAGNDALVKRFENAFFEADLALHYSRPLTQFDHFIGFDDGPPAPETNLRLDFEKVAVRNIADTLLIELPEFWRIEQIDEKSWRCFQPDLSDGDDWGEFIMSLFYEEIGERKARIFQEGVGSGREQLDHEDGTMLTEPLPDMVREGYVYQNIIRMAALPSGIGTFITKLKIKEDRVEDLAFHALRLQIRRAVNRATSPLGPIYPRYGELHEV